MQIQAPRKIRNRETGIGIVWQCESLVARLGGVAPRSGVDALKKKTPRFPEARSRDAIPGGDIATEMLVDAFADRFDVALLISADSDLVPPVRAVLRLFPEKRVNVAFPPERHSKELKDSASGQFVITRGSLKKSQFPDEVATESGFILKRPVKWN